MTYAVAYNHKRLLKKIFSVSLLTTVKSIDTVKLVQNGHFQKDRKFVFKTNYHLLQIKSIQREHSAIFSTFIKLPVVIKTFIMSIFECPFYPGFTVL